MDVVCLQVIHFASFVQRVNIEGLMINVNSKDTLNWMNKATIVLEALGAKVIYLEQRLDKLELESKRKC